MPQSRAERDVGCRLQADSRSEMVPPSEGLVRTSETKSAEPHGRGTREVSVIMSSGKSMYHYPC